MPVNRRMKTRYVLLSLWSISLFGSCSLIPLDDSRGTAARRVRFGVDHRPFAAGEIIFSHEVHSSELCETCHFGTTTADTKNEELALRARAVDDEPESLKMPPMATCFGCHDGDDLTRECIVCHKTNRQQRKPVFHDGVWPRHHKNMAEREAYKCALCHAESECRGCHTTQKPLSHTPRFARSSHGRLAVRGRRSCATCHELSFCENCHSQPPPDHTPIFMRGGGHRQAALVRSRSCLVCHDFEDACSECHNR